MLGLIIKLVQLAPKVTIMYWGVCMIYGVATNNILFGATIFLDLLDYFPVD